MKKNDMALIVLIVSVTLVASYFVAKAILPERKSGSVQVEVVEPISTTITQPETSVFNANAINPTVPINIGDTSNQQPFQN